MAATTINDGKIVNNDLYKRRVGYKKTAMAWQIDQLILNTSYVVVDNLMMMMMDVLISVVWLVAIAVVAAAASAARSGVLVESSLESVAAPCDFVFDLNRSELITESVSIVHPTQRHAREGADSHAISCDHIFESIPIVKRKKLAKSDHALLSSSSSSAPLFQQ